MTNATEAAALIRTDIKAAVQAGELGELPKGVKFTVRTEYASLMSSITVTVRGASAEWGLVTLYEDRKAGTPAAKELGQRLLEIVERHYQRQRSHRFVDVAFAYGEGRRVDLI